MDQDDMKYITTVMEASTYSVSDVAQVLDYQRAWMLRQRTASTTSSSRCKSTYRR